MGKILAKNWKRIFIVVGAVVLAFLLFCKLTWKPNVIDEYVRSDINVERDVIDSMKGGSKEIRDEIRGDDDEKLTYNPNTGEVRGSRSVIGWIVIFVIVFVAILLLDSFMQAPSSSGAKKK